MKLMKGELIVIDIGGGRFINAKQVVMMVVEGLVLKLTMSNGFEFSLEMESEKRLNWAIKAFEGHS